jgi:hypothetical protein
MTNPTITIHDTETDQIETREMNTVELSQYEKDFAESQAKQAQAEAKATARAQILDRLGLTDEEAKILLG